MNAKPAKSVSKVAAILLTALGSFLIGACFFLLGLSLNTPHDKSTLTKTFILIARTCFPFAVAVGVFCLSFAFQAWSRISAAVIRRLSLIVAFVFCIWLFELAISRLEEVDSALASSLSTPIILLAGGLFHWSYSKCLIKWLSLPDTIDWVRREKAAKSFFLLVAFFLFFPCSFILALVSVLAVKVLAVKVLAGKIGLLVGRAWELGMMVLVGLISVLLAYLFYKTSVRFALRNKPVQAKEKADDKPEAQ